MNIEVDNIYQDLIDDLKLTGSSINKHIIAQNSAPVEEVQAVRCVAWTLLEGFDGGAKEIRTLDFHNAIVTLFQLSYSPVKRFLNEGRYIILLLII